MSDYYDDPIAPDPYADHLDDQFRWDQDAQQQANVQADADAMQLLIQQQQQAAEDATVQILTGQDLDVFQQPFAPADDNAYQQRLDQADGDALLQQTQQADAEMLLQQTQQADADALQQQMAQTDADMILLQTQQADADALQQQMQQAEQDVLQQQTMVTESDARAQLQSDNDHLFGTGDPDSSRGDEIREMFREEQDRYDVNQADPPPDYQPGAADLNEPLRMPELDSGYDPNWEPEGRWRFPAEDRGEWVEGGKGDGLWQPYDPGAYGLDEGQVVPFVEGVPDFRDYAVETPSGEPGTFTVDGLQGDEGDYDRAVQALAEQEQMHVSEVEQWLQDEQLRLHHFGDDEMQIVPDRLHGALGHQGSARELRD